MGLFSSSKKTYVSSTTINVIDDPGNPEKSAVLHSILNQSNLTDDLLTTYTHGMHLKFNSAYAYGRDHYTYGLPQGTLDRGMGDADAVRAVLETLAGTGVVMEYCVLATDCDDDFAYPFLLTSRGWNPDTGVVTVHPFVTTTAPVYFLDALVTNTNTLQLTYEYTPFSVPIQVSETVTIAGLVPKALYYRVCYYKMNGDGTLQANRNYWNYRIGAGTYPTLNNPPNSGLASPFFPIIPLRKNNTDLTHSSLSSTDLYKTSKTLLKKVGLDFLHLGESINANPDVGEVDHVFLYFGVDLQSSVAATQRYLLEFFAQLAPLSRTSYAEYLRWKKQPTTLPPQSKLTIEDAGYKADISYSYIRVRFVTGSIGKVGTVTRTNTIRDRLRWGTSVFYFRYYEDSSITFRVQIASNVYKEVEVRGLTHTNYVYNKHSVITNLEDSIKDDYSFIVPLHHSVYANMSSRMRMNVANDGLKIVFQSYKTVRTKWYESGFFQFVMVAIAVVAASFGAWQVSAGILAASSATEVAMLILASIVKVIAISYAFRLVTDVLGVELTLIIAAVLAVYTMGSGIQQGSLKGVPYASELLSASSGLSKAASENIADQISDLMGEAQQNKAEQDLMWDKLESAQELLATNGIINPLEFVNTVPALQPYESPDEYYYRTVHSGNIGVLSLDAPTNYVDYMLMLPRASEPTLA